MPAFIVLLLAILSRLLPHALHGVGMNFTAVGGSLLFFGARRPRWQALIAAGLMALTDVYLTRVVFDFPFHVRSYLVTWIWYAAICLMGSQWLRKVTPLRVAAGVVSTATSFFVLSNLVVWFGDGMYAHTLAGLTTCYVAALPFFANDLVSDTLTAAVLFGLPVLAAQLVSLWRSEALPQQNLR